MHVQPSTPTFKIYVAHYDKLEALPPLKYNHNAFTTDNYVIKFKNLTKEQVKQLRVELDDVSTHFFEKPEISEF